jgi:OmcA/MtrC family decaheme c-type cytochrome
VKYFDLSVLNRPAPHWTRFALAGVLAAALAGCGGSDGSDGAAGPAGPAGAQGPAGGNAVATVKASTLTPDQWRALSLKGEVTKVTVNSAPVVEFKITDAAGNPVIGLGDKDSTGAYPNFMFSIAKLIPGDPATNSPSRWVSYMPFASGTNATPMFPEYDHHGTLKDNLDGTYSYTFSLDITKVKGYVDAYTGYDANHVKSDLDDLTYDPNLPHRLIISAGFKLPGTTTLVGSSANISYDFIPATGKVVAATDAQREIVSINSCNQCHSKLTMHTNFFPGVHDTKLCVVCHTEQVKYGSGETMPASGNVLVPAGTYAAYGATLKLSGRALPNFPNMVHHIHMGKELYYQGYNQFGVKYNEVTYPQPITNCVKCHDGSATAVNKTAQGDNWKNVPSRLACGACHDGINFATGGGTNLSGTYAGHIGGAKADDKLCATCHDAAAIPTYHVTVDPTGANGRGGYPLNTAQDVPTPGFPSGQGPSIPVASQIGNLPAGVYRINFEIKSVTVAAVTGGKQATVVYRTLKDGSPVTFNATGNLIDNVDGNPGIYLAFGTPVDGITTPVDWNGPTSAVAKFKELRTGTGGTQTGPDSNGYYTAKLSYLIPSNAKMITAAVGVEYNGFVQLGLAAYPKGIRLREPQFVMMTATGETPRRSIVSNAKCNSCHGQLGVAPSFHSGARNNGEGCAICHQPSTATGHVGAANGFGGGWSVQIKNLVHSIHGSAKRAQAFTYEATAANPDGFKEVTYPGLLSNCEQCHVAGSYDFSASANAAAMPNMLWTTDAKGDMSNPTNAPSIGLSPWVTTLGAGQINYTANNLVSSPVASSCFGCHDSSVAVAHMQLNGGTLVSLVSSASNGVARQANGFAFTKVEACMVCHGSGKVADIKAVHMN